MLINQPSDDEFPHLRLGFFVASVATDGAVFQSLPYKMAPATRGLKNNLLRPQRTTTKEGMLLSPLMAGVML